jgi:hypothetical protein
MKTAYELAMERLDNTSPGVKLNVRQKKKLAELDSQYAAKVDEREFASNGESNRLKAAGDFEKIEALEQQLVRERKAIQTELEGKKGSQAGGAQIMGGVPLLFPSFRLAAAKRFPEGEREEPDFSMQTFKVNGTTLAGEVQGGRTPVPSTGRSAIFAVGRRGGAFARAA